MKKIEIMGCGYIGLPTAVTFTLAGYEVCGFDVKAAVVEMLSQGKIHIVEPGLQEALDRGNGHGPAALYHEAGTGGCVHHRRPDAATARRRRRSACPTCALSSPRRARSAASSARADLCVLESTSPPVLDAAGRADRLRGQRPEAGRVYDGALPRAHHSGADAP